MKIIKKQLKIQSIIYLLLSILTLHLLFPILSNATEENNVIYVSSESDLRDLAKRVNGGETMEGYTIKLTKDVNLNSSETNPWKPIGIDEDKPFKGTFDGQNFTISGMYISRLEKKYFGLFGYIFNSNIKNLIVKNSYIFISSNDFDKIVADVGIIVGHGDGISLKNCRTVNCEISITAIIPGGIGGIVGEMGYGSIDRCKNQTNISAVGNSENEVSVGGIAGICNYIATTTINYSNITKCSNYGNISGERMHTAGGIVGRGSDVLLIEDCCNMGNIMEYKPSGNYHRSAGGIIGEISNKLSTPARINRCYNMGDINNSDSAGGIVAIAYVNTVTNCYNIGSVTGWNDVGGIAGRNGYIFSNGAYQGIVENCYNIGIVNSERENAKVGNVIGFNNEKGIVKNCYYLENNNEAIGKNISTEEISATAKSSEDMKKSEFVNMLNQAEFKIDEKDANNNYPILLWVTDIEIEKKPEKLTYKKNTQDLDLSGGKIKVTHNYNQYDTILDMNSDKLTLSGFDNTQEGNKEIKVLYKDNETEEEFEKSFQVTIVDDNSPPELSISYNTTKITNEDVTATITANEEIQEVEGWEISTDKKSITKRYSQNTNDPEEITIKDLVGNEAKINVNIENIDKNAPELSILYSTTKITNEDVTVTITANEKIQEVEGWTLGEDGKSLTKTYTENKTEEITIYDLAGNATNQEVKIKNIEGKTATPTKTANLDQTIKLGVLPKAGSKKLLIIVIIMIVASIMLGIKCRNFKDIK